MTTKNIIGLILLALLGYLMGPVLHAARLHTIVPTLIAAYLVGQHLRDRQTRGRS